MSAAPEDAAAAIAGQPRAEALLRRAAEGGPLFPSLIFHGPSGVGKLTAALALARTLLCLSPPRPCGRCRSCRRIQAAGLAHPAVRVVFPETVADFEKGATAEGGSAPDLQETQAEAEANPGRSVLIGRIRQAIAFLHRLPPDGPVSVLIVDQADRMEGPAANALLKTLEEPPPHAVILLLTPSLHALLATIRSRCQAVPFQPVTADAVAAHLIETRAVPAEEAILRARLSSGRIGRALALDLEAFRARRERLFAILDDLIRDGDPGVAVTRAEALAKGGALDADLDVLMTMVRDLAILAVDEAAEARLVNVDAAARLRPLAALWRSRGGDVAAPIVALDEALEGLRRRANRQLVVENFLIGLVPESRGGGARGAGVAMPRTRA